jgi:adenine-specific DNA-methyltransferase
MNELVKPLVSDEHSLAWLAVALGAGESCELTGAEQRVLSGSPLSNTALIRSTKRRMEAGDDPLGQTFAMLRTPVVRRQRGAVYTPQSAIDAMFDLVAGHGIPQRIVDPGAGSARFLLEGGRRFKKAQLIAVENDPLAALIARANLHVAGLTDRTRVLVQDFLLHKPESIAGKTLWIGNPPYVRHHLIDAQSKLWLKSVAEGMDLKASSLAGLHLYFYLAIARRAQIGDFGSLITASEWLDVNYGQLLRDLFLQNLGGQSIHLVDQKTEPFPGTATTAAITTFRIGDRPSSVRFAKITSLGPQPSLPFGRRIRRERLEVEPRWTFFVRNQVEVPQGYVELGELCRVHRGQVTGANHVWIAGSHSVNLPKAVLYPTVTRATELIQAGRVLTNSLSLREVIDLPSDLSSFSHGEQAAIHSFLRMAESMGAHSCYTARHRKAWWTVGLRSPAPILATYMARRAPAFVLNEAKARHINIAHGLYPRVSFGLDQLNNLARYLGDSATTSGGRVYAGGLTKFEPREMERIPVPTPELLKEMFQ